MARLDKHCNDMDLVDDEPLSARSLILDLIDIDDAATVDVRQLTRAGEAFGIEAAGIRTGLARLKREGTIEQVGRGRYAVGVGGQVLQRRVAGWRDVLNRRRTWKGDWLLVVAGPLERADRTTWRRTLRALELEGFMEAETNVWTRPDNLVGGAKAIRARLNDLECAPSLLLVRASGMDPARQRAYPKLWPTEALQASHAELTELLQRAAEALTGAHGHDAARTALTLGRRAVRQILRDPLLPDDICSPQPLARLIAAMTHFDTLGKRIWQDFFAAGTDDQGPS